MQYLLSDEQQAFWQQNRYLILTNFIEDIEALVSWCNDIMTWPDAPGKWMKYYETNQKGQSQLCRVENILQYHSDVNELARGKRTLALLSQLMGEEACLFKEKINVKLPGGNGFTPHQDAPAFITFKQTYHITMMVAIDEATLENGCLKIATNYQHGKQTLPQKKDGSIADEWVQQFSWQPLLTKPGDVVLFDSYLPHYSEANHSHRSRRAFFITYNRLSEGGSKREDYFADKRQHFPQNCERLPNTDYSAGASIYNVANPIGVTADE
jgi:hypothetical protein